MKQPKFFNPIKMLSYIGLVFFFTFGVARTSAEAQCACQRGFIVPLDSLCEATISTSMVFTGAGCPTDDFRIVVFDQSTIPPSSIDSATAFQDSIFGGEGSWMYGVYTLDIDGSYDLFCWNDFFTEDKQSPEFYCPTTETESGNFQQYGAYEPVDYNIFVDSLESSPNSSNQFRPGLWSCWQSTNHEDTDYTWPDNQIRNYKVIEINPAEDAVYTFFVGSELNTGTSDPEFDAAVAIFGRGGFQPQDPCQNILAFGQSTFIPNPLGGLGFVESLSSGSLPGTFVDTSDIFAPWLLYPHPIVRIDLKLLAGQSYELVVTSREPNATGDFELYVLRNQYDSNVDGAVLLDTINGDPLTIDTKYKYFDFLCGDLEKVMLPKSVTLTQTEYLTGGRVDLLANLFGTDTTNSIVGDYWNSLGATLLSTAGNPDTFRSLDYYYYDSVETVELLQYNYCFKPLVFENCSDWDVTISDTYSGFGDCGVDQGSDGLIGLNISGQITRRYVVQDAGAKNVTDECSITMNFRTPSLLDIRLPHYTSFVECDDVADIYTLDNGHPSPKSTGYPFLVTLSGIIDLTPESAYCNLGAAFRDVARVDVCEESFRFRREWTIYDWCRPGTSVIYNQIIKVGDWTPPVITAGNINTAISSYNCNGSARIQRGSATDLCTATENIEIEISIQDNQGNIIAYYPAGTGPVDVLNLTVGDYTVVWTATDNCGNQDTISSAFAISDGVAPSCVIDDVRNVSLTNYSNSFNNLDSTTNGTAWLEATRMDEGSKDNCFDVNIEVRRKLGASGSDAVISWLAFLEMTESEAVNQGRMSVNQGIFYTEWRSDLPFYCVDVVEGEQDVIAEMRVTEDRINGLSSLCWMYINVEDKTDPSCYDLNTQTYVYNCDDVPSGNLNATGAWDEFFTDVTLENVLASSICGSVLQVVGTTSNISSCGVGSVTREYRIVNNSNALESQICSKTITFVENHDYYITFPADTSITCGAVVEAEAIQWSENSCDLITLSNLPKETFAATADECYKEFRTFRLINWCEYDGDGSPIVISRDEDGDQILGEKVTVNVKYSGTSDSSEYAYWTSANPQEYNAANFIKRADLMTYSTGASYEAGYFQYTQVVKVYDDKEPTIVINTTDLQFESYNNDFGTGMDYCPGSVSISANVTDDCTTESAQIQIVDVLLDIDNDGQGLITRSDKNFDFNLSTGDYVAVKEGNVVTITDELVPIGTHSYRIVASDGCGNVRVEDVQFEVYDAKAPAPICIEGLAIELMPNSNQQGDLQMSVQAIDFINPNTVIADCHPDYTYYILRAESYNGTGFDTRTVASEIINSSNLAASALFTCTDVTESTSTDLLSETDNLFTVYVVMEDGVGNRDYCSTTVDVQDNVNSCSTNTIVQAAISGLVTTEEDELVKDVELVMSGSDNRMVMSSSNGDFMFDNLTMGMDYTITPKKVTPAANGVSTFDMVLISKHILSVKPLDSPYQLIAADVNNSKSITTLDLIQMRKVILSISDQFSSNKTWRFIPTSYNFSNPRNPWADNFPEVLNINNLDKSVNTADFVAIKVGDVNNSATLDIQPRSGEVFKFTVEDILLEKGKEYTVKFDAETSKVLGYQFALEFDPEKLALQKIQEITAKEENFGTRFIEEGIILTSWNGDTKNNEMFGLVFQAKEDSKLSDLLKVSSRYLNAEAYNLLGEAMGVSLHFTSGSMGEASFALEQNAPNPFKNTTNVGFTLPEESFIEFTVTDLNGKVIKVLKGNYNKGNHILQLLSKDLPQGMLYYSLKTNQGLSETKSMLVIE
ncbi:MAG: hypothetical protein RLZZ248_1467 [Bacteroidota bacterium]